MIGRAEDGKYKRTTDDMEEGGLTGTQKGLRFDSHADLVGSSPRYNEEDLENGGNKRGSLEG